jgi:hypothetical protein
VARARIDETAGRDAVRAVLAHGEHPDRTVTALAVRYLLQVLAEASPGKSVEVRVPPWGAVQAVEGPKHTRGTPPNVVELDPPTFLAIATGGLEWAAAVAAGRVQASGARSDLAALFPLAY